MTVYKYFMRIALRNKGVILSYTIIFFILSILNGSSNAQKENSFMSTKLCESNEPYSPSKKFRVNCEVRMRKVVIKISHIPSFIMRLCGLKKKNISSR